MTTIKTVPVGEASRYATLAAILCLLVILVFPVLLPAADEPLENKLPSPGFSKVWVMDGKTASYTRDNLYTYINGEAELYVPYGFSALSSALYAKPGDSKTALVADIFQMGSAIDAFGIYSRYRNPDAEVINIGGGGFIDESQLMFYKDRYFVRLSSSGDNPERNAFIDCAEAIARKIPGRSAPPEELALLNIPGVISGTEKYTAQSVLGYAFFKRGLTADARLDGQPVKVFVIIGETVKDGADIFDKYMAYLKEKGNKLKLDKRADGVTLVAQDPLYKGVLVRQAGRHVFGITNLKTP
ncbi:MAG: hypothetical protein C0399_11100 [Syntrophus sp. (in: bacteria)]|nr:hypothetical protein [Syntrophus sp. (in: bacteria)]